MKRTNKRLTEKDIRAAREFCQKVDGGWLMKIMDGNKIVTVFIAQ